MFSQFSWSPDTLQPGKGTRLAFTGRGSVMASASVRIPEKLLFLLVLQLCYKEL